jgi:hypothetical protein
MRAFLTVTILFAFCEFLISCNIMKSEARGAFERACAQYDAKCETSIKKGELLLGESPRLGFPREGPNCGTNCWLHIYGEEAIMMIGDEQGIHNVALLRIRKSPAGILDGGGETAAEADGYQGEMPLVYKNPKTKQHMIFHRGKSYDVISECPRSAWRE